MWVKQSFLIMVVMVLLCCNNKKNSTSEAVNIPQVIVNRAVVAPETNSAANILAKKQVPILCYHHINNKKPGDYTVSPVLFAQQLQA